jgi:hypothetical protein
MTFQVTSRSLLNSGRLNSSYPVIGQVAVGNGEVDPGDEPIGELG